MLDKIYNNVYNTFADLDPQRAVRLAIIVGIYAIFRSFYQGHLKKKHLQYQLDMDKQKKMKDGMASSMYPEDPEEAQRQQEKEEARREEAKPVPFGFGNKTRKKVKKQEKIIKDKYEALKQEQEEMAKMNLPSYKDDTADIADLLED
ncbi:hypothetical protein ACO0QE_001109 [Hanseniaspora vineae]